jgi:hypothetical protein
MSGSPSPLRSPILAFAEVSDTVSRGTISKERNPPNGAANAVRRSTHERRMVFRRPPTAGLFLGRVYTPTCR